MREFNFIKEGFKVGDKVFSGRYGEGTITVADRTGDYPLEVNHEISHVTYTAEGRIIQDDKFPTLFPNAFEIPESAYEIPLKDKELVECWDEDDTHRHMFKFYDKVNSCTFRFNGTRDASDYDNYKKVEGEWPEWAVEAVKTLED